MLITLHGVRGSIPVPGPQTIRYGGNTTCISITTDEGDQIIIDGGTGIREYGMKQMTALPLTAHLFLTHTHWDHIQGLPFYTPLFVPGNTIHFYGSFDPVYRKNLQTILAQQMEYCYFPVRESELKATIHYHRIQEGAPITIGSAVVTPILLNHPVLNHGYRVTSHGKSFFFTGDYEP
ncbi:MAG: MBL fold metallo-hydrolase, partial [Gammaproteobacteria bacterium]